MRSQHTKPNQIESWLWSAATGNRMTTLGLRTELNWQTERFCLGKKSTKRVKETKEEEEEEEGEREASGSRRQRLKGGSVAGAVAAWIVTSATSLSTFSTSTPVFTTTKHTDQVQQQQMQSLNERTRLLTTGTRQQDWDCGVCIAQTHSQLGRERERERERERVVHRIFQAKLSSVSLSLGSSALSVKLAYIYWERKWSTGRVLLPGFSLTVQFCWWLCIIPSAYLSF